MINQEYLKNVSAVNNNTLHEYTNQNIYDSPHSENEFNNLLYNSNLDQSNIIK